jgi:hypothetical protein
MPHSSARRENLRGPPFSPAIIRSAKSLDVLPLRPGNVAITLVGLDALEARRMTQNAIEPGEGNLEQSGRNVEIALRQMNRRGALVRVERESVRALVEREIGKRREFAVGVSVVAIGINERRGHVVYSTRD